MSALSLLHLAALGRLPADEDGIVPLGRANVGYDPSTGSLVVDRTSLSDRDASPDFGWDDDDDDEFGDDEYGDDEYGDDEYGDDEYGDDDIGELVEALAGEIAGRRRRRKHAGKGKARRAARRARRHGGTSAARPPSLPATKSTSISTAYGNTATVGAAGTVTLTISVTDDCELTEITFSGSTNISGINSVQMNKTVVFNAGGTGANPNDFGPTSLIRGILGGRKMKAGQTIIITATASAAGTIAASVYGRDLNAGQHC